MLKSKAKEDTIQKKVKIMNKKQKQENVALGLKLDLPYFCN